MAAEIAAGLYRWWQSCPAKLRHQPNDWRRQIRPADLPDSRVREEEAISTIRSCIFGSVIYLGHILDPSCEEPRTTEMANAIDEILEISNETPDGCGLEVGLYFGLFMVGIATFNEPDKESFIRMKLKADAHGLYVSLSRFSKTYAHESSMQTEL